MKDKQTLPLEVDPLMKFVEKTFKAKPSFVPSYHQIHLNLEIESFTIPIYFEIRREGELLQVVAYLPYAVPRKKEGEIGRLLHRFNRDLDQPGFGMDEEANFMFYRLAIPCPEKAISELLLSTYLRSLKTACQMAIKTIEEINKTAADA